tara:strand:- start:436 stop:1176 length:741 start_codon:yes stop_codon:yes gene_type:complete
MNKTAVIIPSRLSAERLPNKPLKMINDKEMILHVYEAAIKSKVGEVIVATPDQQIAEIIEKIGGLAVITKKNHQTGTDRVFEAFNYSLNSKPDVVINLQGDMPNIDPTAIAELAEYMGRNKCDIGTLASDLNFADENKDPNVVKVVVKDKLLKKSFVNAQDFYRINEAEINNIYHHVGIYGFTGKSLIKYVSLERSKLELSRKLEQLRALENGMTIHVGYIKSSPISVDTEEDLIAVKKLMKNEKR